MTIDNELLLDELGRATMLARRTRHANAVAHHKAHKGHHGAPLKPMPYETAAEDRGLQEGHCGEHHSPHGGGFDEACGCQGHGEHRGHHGKGHHGHHGPHGEDGCGCHGEGGHGGYGKGRCHGGGHGKRRVLALLAMKEGMSQKDLAFLLGIRPQSASELLAKLQDQGFIERRQDENDKRVTKVYLTEKGREHAERCAQMHQAMAADVFSVLTEEEKEQLFTILGKLSESLERRERAPKADADETPVV